MLASLGAGMAHELAHALAYLRAVWICVGGLILAAPITVE